MTDETKPSSESKMTPDEHAELAPSSAHRWLNCPGSIAAQRGLPNVSSAASIEGTAAHEVAAQCLRMEQDAIEYLDRTVLGVLVTEDMAHGVQVYLDEVRSRYKDTLPSTRFVEARVALVELRLPWPFGGTADSIVYVTGHRAIHIHDLKFGAGNRVEASSPQLKIYALGAYFYIMRDPRTNTMPPVNVVCTIVQPRQPAAGRDPIRTVQYTVSELLEWAREVLVPGALEAMTPDAPRKAGAWCKFCLASGSCKAQAEAALSAAQAEFAFAPYLIPDELPAESLTLTSAELGHLMTRFSVLGQWMDDVRKLAARTLADGGVVPGWKLVAGQGHAKWKTPDEAAQLLTFLYGVDPWAPREIISPATARDVVVNGAFKAGMAAWGAMGNPKAAKPTKAAIKDQVAKSMAALTYRPQTSVLARDDDPRPALLTGGREFLALTDETA